MLTKLVLQLVNLLTLFADGGMVTIDDDLFIEGRNVIELIITYANNQSYVVVMTYEMERSTPGNTQLISLFINAIIYDKEFYTHSA